MKKIFLLLFFLSFISLVSADSISDMTITKWVRSGENIVVAGNYINPDVNDFVLCKFQIKDANGVFIDRWSDEYTFADGSFYAEKASTQPPYYVGDSFTIQVNCSTATDSNSFTILQPLGFSHPVQTWWEFAWGKENTNALLTIASFVLIIIMAILLIVFLIKRGSHYAGS